MGVRTAGKGHKVTSVSNGDSDDEQYDLEEQSPINPYPPVAFPVQGFKRRIAHLQDGESAQEGSMLKKAKRSKHQLNAEKGTINNKNRSHTKMEAAANLGGDHRRERGLALVQNTAITETDSTFQATRDNGIWPNEPHIYEAQGSKKSRRAADDETDYHQNGEHHRQAHGSRKAKVRKTA